MRYQQNVHVDLGGLNLKILGYFTFFKLHNKLKLSYTPGVCLHMKEKFPSPHLLYTHGELAGLPLVLSCGECPDFVH